MLNSSMVWLVGVTVVFTVLIKYLDRFLLPISNIFTKVTTCFDAHTLRSTDKQQNWLVYSMCMCMVEAVKDLEVMDDMFLNHLSFQYLTIKPDFKYTRSFYNTTGRMRI